MRHQRQLHQWDQLRRLPRLPRLPQWGQLPRPLHRRQLPQWDRWDQLRQLRRLRRLPRWDRSVLLHRLWMHNLGSSCLLHGRTVIAIILHKLNRPLILIGKGKVDGHPSIRMDINGINERYNNPTV